MATNAGLAARLQKQAHITSPLNIFLSRYFYLSMALLSAAIIVAGFSRTVDANLLHARPPRPFLLWIHGAAFSTWLVFFIAQSALVRVRKVAIHRLLGWFGAVLAAAMFLLGCAITPIMAHFDRVVLGQGDAPAFMSVPFCDMVVFGTAMALAIYWRKRPEFHRRLVLVASLGLLDAGIGRFDFWFNNNLFYPFIDALVVVAMLRDWRVDGRVHKVYLYALPVMAGLHALAIYLWRANPAYWQAVTHAILGI